MSTSIRGSSKRANLGLWMLGTASMLVAWGFRPVSTVAPIAKGEVAPIANGDPAPPLPPTQAPAGDPKPWNPSLGTAAVKGVVRFTGKPPKRREIEMGSDPKCHELHQEPLRDESVVLDEKGNLRNVFVYVKKGLESWRFEPPKAPVMLDQKGCAYVPHVVGLLVGQRLEIKNGDPVVHNVHAFAQKNESFNQSQASGSAALEKLLSKPEVMVTVKCDIHGWMSSYVGVLDHPFFAVTGEGGTFELKGLPPGDYEIAAWHEIFGTQKLAVSVGSGETKEIELTFAKKQER